MKWLQRGGKASGIAKLFPATWGRLDRELDRHWKIGTSVRDVDYSRLKNMFETCLRKEEDIELVLKSLFKELGLKYPAKWEADERLIQLERDKGEK